MDREKIRLGGMALNNGLLVHGPTHWAAAVRSEEGELKVASGEKPRFKSLERIPGLRGLGRLAEAFAVIPLVRINLPEARLPFEDARVAVATASAAALSAAVRKHTTSAAGELAVATIGLIPALLALRGSQLAAYHGVEHKAIGAYELGKQPAEGTKEHDRCGSNLVLPMMAASVVGTVLTRRVLGRSGPLARAAVSLGSAAIAIEAFGWAERHSDTALAKILRRPGNEMQRLFVTKEPDQSQLEVGEAAMDEILKLEEQSKPAHV